MKVLVISADGFHLGYLGCYGNEWIATPTLDQLATEGIVFDQHYSDRPEVRGARQTWRTGNYLFPDITAATLSSTPTTPSPDLLQPLQAAGITTSLVIESKKSKEFASGWSIVHDFPTRNKGAALEQVLETALAAVDELADRESWLIWLEMPTLLPPWNVPKQLLQRYFENDPEEDSTDSQPLDPLINPEIGFIDKNDDVTLMRLQRTYAAAVSYLDRGLEALFEELQARNLMDEVLIVVTTERGFPLGEHGLVGAHRPWLHDELIHLPLIVRLPAGTEAGRRISALTQPVDLMPSLLEAFGLPILAVHGFSWWPLMRGEKACLRPYACSGLRTGEACEWALRTPEWAFLLPLQASPHDPSRGPQLYVKPDDRWEVNDVFQHNMELAENLAQVLRRFVAATRQPGPLLLPELNAQGLQPAGPNQANPQLEGTES
jgi:arylsulfatase A-like enzyme